MKRNLLFWLSFWVVALGASLGILLSGCAKPKASGLSVPYNSSDFTSSRMVISPASVDGGMCWLDSGGEWQKGKGITFADCFAALVKSERGANRDCRLRNASTKMEFDCMTHLKEKE